MQNYATEGREAKFNMPETQGLHLQRISDRTV